MQQDNTNQSRRNFLFVASGALGGVAAAATAIPFVASMMPAADTMAASSTEYDVSTVEAGQQVVIAWRGKPVFVVNRTEEMLKRIDGHDEHLKDVDSKSIPDVQASWMKTAEQRKYRSIKPEYLVVIASCTHLGCIPLYKPSSGQAEWGESVPPDWAGGWHCPCHGSLYDLSARVMHGSPAPDNLYVAEYVYKSESVIYIG